MPTLAELQAQQASIAAQIAALDIIHMTAVQTALADAQAGLDAVRTAVLAAHESLSDPVAKKRMLDFNNVLTLMPPLITEDATRIQGLADAAPGESGAES